MAKIKEVYCREIYGSQGLPAIETKIVLSDGSVGVSSVAASDSGSKYAAVNLVEREQNKIHGKGTFKAVEKIQNIIAPKLIDFEVQNLQDIDGLLFEMDGTPNKSRFGANATLSISIAAARACAASAKQELYVYLRQYIKSASTAMKMPTIIFCVINGGRTTGNMLDFKDFFVIPASFKTFEESLNIGYAVQSKLASVLQHKQIPPLFSTEGGYALLLPDNETAFALLEETIETSNFRLGFDVFLGIDADAGNFFINEKYHLKDTSMPLEATDLINIYSDFIDKHNILYIEDPLTEDDWEGWVKIGGKINNDKLIIGDMFTATNPSRLQTAIAKKAISGVVIEPIQTGTITEALLVAEIARLSGIKIVVSRQNGGTMDDFLADFSVAVNADYVNFGALTRGENVVNYNRLLMIEKQLEKV